VNRAESRVDKFTGREFQLRADNVNTAMNFLANLLTG
jgi:hypothetical protein